MIFILLLLSFLLRFPLSVEAVYNPLSVPNNKYGIHIADTNDLSDIPALVNSTGGDWGYVTLVIEENDRNLGKWQKIFDQMRKYHIIPIVRLATHVEGSAWTIPKEDSFREWVDFLSKLRWVVKNRYVIVFNEPNHANEWGSSINPEEYADRLVTLGKLLKESSDDFFILPAGLDASADGNSHTMDETTFLRRMIAYRPEIGSLIDGWTSHSYPNPGFSGSPFAWGKGSLRTFDWELSFLRQLGVVKSLPVFITETGWIHSEGTIRNPGLLSPENIGGNLQIAASSVWTDPAIVAITPFVFSYQGLPFDHFSWKKLGGGDFYAHYFAYQSIPKLKGKPKKKELYELKAPIFPPKMIASSIYDFTTPFTNTGEALLDASYKLVVTEETNRFSVTAEALPTVEPERSGEMILHVKTPETPGTYALSFSFTHDDDTIFISRQEITVVPPPSISINAQLAWRTLNSADHVSVLFYDTNDTVLAEFTDLALTNGNVTIPEVKSVVPNAVYRIVMLVPYYLPRQIIARVGETKTEITMKRFLPFDLDQNGALTFADVIGLINSRPNTILPRFFGP